MPPHVVGMMRCQIGGVVIQKTIYVKCHLLDDSLSIHLHFVEQTAYGSQLHEFWCLFCPQPGWCTCPL
uniref:Uncharacterized protein n=1 Tax=Rhizophora mucronata TaxID=61149 RepID=A0A2P2Q7F8_RHIMU